METYTSSEDISRIVNSEHWDPFHVLGMHQITMDNGEKGCVVRVMQPRAKKIWLMSTELDKPEEMHKIHESGFFIASFPGAGFFTYHLKIENHEGHQWEITDPYQYSPVISEFDLHLFAEGNNHKLYRMLGAHLCTHNDVEGVHFAVWAPNASRVSVVGNFNHWDGRENMMRSRGGSGVWEIFIPGLTEHEIYKYEIRTQGGSILQKQDPYGFACELRPRTGSKVWNIDKYQWSESNTRWVQERNSQSCLGQPVSVYEVHLGSWMRSADGHFLSYHDLAEKLASYVTDLGYTHIELLPVAEHPLDASWGYQVTGYFAPTSRFGSPDDFKHFVDVLHQHGIGIILDWVPAHFPCDAHGLAGFDGTALYEHVDPRKGFHQDWQTMIFNYGRNEVVNFLISNAVFWIEEYCIDGLRVDAVASMLYLDYARQPGEWIPNEHGGNENLEAVYFIKKMNEVVYSYHNGVMMIAEESTSWPAVSRPTYLGGLGYGLKWNMGWMNDFLEYVEKEPVHRKYHHNNLTFGLIYAFHENFVLVISHDEVVHGKQALISKMPGDDWQKFANVRAAIGYMFAHPGKKLLFQGCEFGQWSEWNFDQSLDWHLLQYEPHQQLHRFIRDINRIYREYGAMHQVDFEQHGFEWVDFHDWESSIVSFLRKGRNADDVVLAVCNFTPVPRYNYRVGVPLHCDWEEIINSDAGIYGGGNMGNNGGYWSNEMPWQGKNFSLELTIPPLAIVLFAPRKHLIEPDAAHDAKTAEAKKPTRKKTEKKQ